jgi:hypothetical protein
LAHPSRADCREGRPVTARKQTLALSRSLAARAQARIAELEQGDRAAAAHRGGRMGNLLFWLGIGAAQKGAGSKPIERRHWVASLIVGILIALLIAVGMFFLLVSQQ